MQAHVRDGGSREKIKAKEISEKTESIFFFVVNTSTGLVGRQNNVKVSSCFTLFVI